jgi:8-oxo-dGTP pyrophosphatase MutT (NUDIX family)
MSRGTAAALLITRGEGPDRAVFLVERSPELRFFGGYWALPGGTVGDEDRHDRQGDEAAALQPCAHRELFEETGLLRHRLPATHTSGDALRTLRERLIAHEAKDAAPAGPSPWPSLLAGSAPPPRWRGSCVRPSASAPCREGSQGARHDGMIPA